MGHPSQVLQKSSLTLDTADNNHNLMKFLKANSVLNINRDRKIKIGPGGYQERPGSDTELSAETLRKFKRLSVLAACCSFLWPSNANVSFWSLIVAVAAVLALPFPLVAINLDN